MATESVSANPGGMSDDEYLADMNAMLTDMGMRPYSSIEELRAKATRPTVTLGTEPEEIESVRTRYAQPGQRTGNGYVRLVSDRQIAFIRRLLAERDTRSLVRLPGSENIERMSLKGATDLIQRLLACPELPKVKADREAGIEPKCSPKQAEWLEKLANKDVPEEIEAIRLKGKDATKSEASKALDVLFKARNKTVTVTTDSDPNRKDETLTLGIYLYEGAYYRIQKRRQGPGAYCKKLDRENGDAWIYAPGIINRLTPEMKLTLEECEALSLAIGCCCMCGRELTATVNGIGPGQRFIGPICQSKMGF